MASLFVDSSAFYAAVDRGDRHHQRAAAVLGAGDPLVTSDHVLVEAWLLLKRRHGGVVADRFWQEIHDGAARLESVRPADLQVAWEIRRTSDDQDFSIVDCTSFAVMHRLGLTHAATFDDDFAIYRYGPRRERAFEVVR